MSFLPCFLAALLFLAGPALADEPTIQDFEKIKIGAPVPASVLGKPTSEDTFQNIGKTVVSQSYGTSLELWLNSDSKNVLSKIFFPKPKTELSNLDHLLNARYKHLKFSKERKNCSFHAEVAYVDRTNGIMILTKNLKGEPVRAVVEADSSIVEGQLNENAKRTCSK